MRTSLSPRTDIKSASRPKSGNVMKSSKRTVQKKKSYSFGNDDHTVQKKKKKVNW